MGRDKHVRVGQVAVECGEIVVQLGLVDETLGDKTVSDIVDEILKDRPAVVARRVDMCDGVDGNCLDTRFPEQPMQAAADMEVDASGRRIGDIGGKQPVPGGKRRVADMRQEIGLNRGAWVAQRTYEVM